MCSSFWIGTATIFPEALIKVGRFRSETHIVDDREYQGCLFKQVEDVISYFRERLETHYEFTGEPVRNVIWEYPLEALREAVINAVCHRDYMINAHIQVRLYDDHLTFQNPGKLIPPLQIEELKREHLSYLRNRKIAEMLYHAGWIERWGSGTLKIYNACKNAGMPEPNFDEYSETFRLTLMKGRIIEDKIRYKNLNERQLSGMKYVNQKGHISTSEYQRINGVSRATSKRDLAELVNRNLLVSAGSGRASKYILAQTAQKRLINGSSGSENESEI